MYQTLIELLRWRARQQPESHAYTFLVDGDASESRLTYGELDLKARAIGAWLQQTVVPGDRVLLLYPPGLEYIAAFFGCLYAGAVAVPAYPPRHNRNLSRLETLVTDARPAVALTTSSIISLTGHRFAQDSVLAPLVWTASDQIADGSENSWQEPELTGDALALLQYTSGSTSAPKGIMVSHQNLLHNESMIQRAYKQTDQSLIVGWLPLYHDMGLIGNVIQPLFVGAPCILLSPLAFLQQPSRWLKAISRYGATTSGGPNFAYDLCVRKISEEEKEQLDLTSWEVAFNGAEPVRPETMERFANAFASCGFRKEAFYPCYGLAEATLLVSCRAENRPPAIKTVQARALENHRILEAVEDDESRSIIGSGSNFGDQQVKVVNPETLIECRADEVGEVWVSGQSVAQGCWNNDDYTERTFHAHLADTGEGPFLRTGDLGWLEDGELFITGRLKDLIIIRGLNHYPQDIELTVEKCHRALRPGCGAAFSVEVAGAEKLVIVQEINHRERVDGDAIIELINAAVAEEHEVQPHAVVLIKAGTIPKTSSGKLQRYEARNAFLQNTLHVVTARYASSDISELTEAVPALPDAAGIEEWLRAQIAAKVGIDGRKLDIAQPIARYGLDSLTALEIAHEIEINLGVVVPFSLLLDNLGVAQIAEFVRVQLSEGVTAAPAFETIPNHIGEQPLSAGQQALWFLYQVEPESAAYNIGGCARVLSELHLPALTRAFQQLVTRHPSLRTTFESHDGRPVARVRDEAELDFVVEDASNWDEAEVNAYLTREAHRPFDLTADQLLRVRLLEQSGRGHILLVTLHHIIADHWSLALLLNELGVLYDAGRAGSQAELPALARHYSDYVRWQEKTLAGEDGERLRSYWKKKLSGVLPILNLPTDRPRPPVQSYKGAVQTFNLGVDLSRSLKELAQTRGTTLYMTLLAAYQLLLHFYTDQLDILIGSPTSGRGLAEFSQLVGYFVNLIVVRADLAGDPSFEGLLGQTCQTVFEAFGHQDYPFALLTEDLQPVRDASRSPVFQAVFALENLPVENGEGLAALTLGKAKARLKVGSLELESLALEQQTAMFDITLRMGEVGEELTASLEYNTDVFDDDTMLRMVGHFRTLLESVVSEPGRRISELSPLGKEEARLLAEWNETQYDYGRSLCLHELFEEQAALTPEATALVFEGERLSYAELNQRADSLAGRLVQLGVGPEVLVGVFAERSIEMVVALFAILKAGGAYVPLDPSHPAERISFMLEDSGAEVILTQRHLRDALPAHDRVLCLDEPLAQPGKSAHEAWVRPQISPDNLCYVIYTSGSTGRPKGAMNTHGAVVNRLRWMQETYRLTRADCVLQKTPYSFDVSVWEFFWPLIVGARLVIARPDGHQDPRYLARLIEAEKVTTLHFVPSMLQIFLDEPEARQCRSLKRVICSGEALSTALQERFFKLSDAELHNLYGPTEAAVDVTYWACDRESSAFTVPIGRPIANLQIHVLDRYMHPTPLKVPGELYIGGVGVARGYCGRPDLTAQQFIPDPFGDSGSRLYKTGDLARYLPDGSIEFLGRIDHQVKLRGLRIELGEIESALTDHPGVQEAVVMVREYGAGDQRLVAYLVPDPNDAPVVRRLLKLAEEGLPQGRTAHELPNGMTVVHLNKGETDFVYEELFEHRSYLKHGISLDDGACVFDVGANIGLFTLFVGREWRRSKIYAFEPIPPVFDVLQANVDLYGLNAKLFQCGLSDRARNESFTYYPHLSIISGRFAEPEAEREVVKAFLFNDQKNGLDEAAELDASLLDELLDERLSSETFACPLRTISDVIREEAIERIDLLKVDVEKSELDVLGGIDDDDWSKIRQIVVEVHDVDGRLDQVKSLLTERGYRLVIEQDKSLQTTALYNVYANRSEVHAAKTEPNGKQPLTGRWEGVGVLRKDIERHLRDQLPSYMVPSAFVFMPRLPALSNGKVDRRALPAPALDRLELAEKFVSPRNASEQTLAEIWAEVLRLTRVGIYDNFFELGGDSILSIQIVARAYRRGLKFSPRQVFQYQNIAQLALVVETASETLVDQSEVIGQVPLTPVQHWFFAQNLPNPNHWNQSVLLTTRGPMDPSRLERALNQVVAHHDGLRMRFVFGDTGWEQFNLGVEEAASLAVEDLSAVPPSEQQRALEAGVAKAHASLNISTGPLVRAVYFDFGPGKPGKLLLVIHHLVVDGVSWRILLEDLQLCYESQGLPPKTTSFRTWAEGLTDYARSPASKQDTAYWQLPVEQCPRLPRDFKGGINNEESARTVSAALSIEATHALLHEVPVAHRTYITEVLLAALTKSLSKFTEAPSLLIDLEGHGREALVAGADVSRTVGWFTAIYPVSLKLDRPANAAAILRDVKEQLRRIPHNGVGYGVSRFLQTGASDVRSHADFEAEVSFNYLGQLDHVLAGSTLFENAEQVKTPQRSPEGRRPYLFEINGSVVGGQLVLDWTYSDNLHERDTIEKLVEDFLDAVQEIIADHTGEANRFSPSDFPLANLDEAKLAQILESYENVENIYPLSPVQQGLLFHSLYDGSAGVYVQQLSCILRGGLDVAAFERAWRRVIERHTILRTAFAWENLNEPLQVVSRTAELVSRTDDWRGLSPAEQDGRLASFLESDRAQGFDLRRAPLMRIALFQVADDEWRFVWSDHHLLLDGWSLPIVLDEVFRSYEAFSEGRELHLEQSEPFENYIKWTHQQDPIASEAFWRDSLAGFSEPTPLALDRAPDELREHTNNFGEQQSHIPQEATARLQAFARRHHLTLNTLLQGAWALLLNRYSGRADVVFGTAVSGRPVSLPGAQTMVGLFINTLPIRVRVPSEGTLSSWLRELQDRQSQLQKHEHSALVQIQGWSEVPRGLPLFESVLILLNYPIDSALRDTNRSLRVDQVSWFEQTNYPLTMQVTPGRELLLKAAYDPSRFDAAAIERILGHFRTVLEALGSGPSLAEIPVLTEPERRQLLLEWNDTQRHYAGRQCLHELFAEQARRTPGATAVSFEGESLTYAELNERANKLAHHLRKLGVGAELLIGICVERSLELAVGLLGILKAGAAYVPIDPAYPLERLSFLMEDAGVSVLLTQEKLIETLPSHWGHTICLDSDWEVIEEDSGEDLPAVATDENLAYVIYTSGSTGQPKGAMLNHRGIVNCIRWMQDTYKLDDSDRFLLKTSLNFDPSVWELFWTWSIGGRVVIARPEGHLDSAYLVETIRREQVTSIYFVPSMLRVFLDEPGLENAASLRRVICGGEGLAKETMDRFFERLSGVEFHHSYGPTEASIAATEWRCEPGLRKAMAPIGRPLANTEIYLLDEQLRPVPVGVAADLYIGGMGVGRGYLRQPQLTGERFIPHPFSNEPGARMYKSGDVARYLPDGTIEFVGRKDSQVKIRGYRIELGEIEAALSRHPAVETVAVTVKDGPDGDKQLVAYVVSGEAASEPGAELRSYLGEKVPSYMVPAAVIVLDEMPLTANGKIDRLALPSPESIGAQQELAITLPRTPIEEVLVGIWAEVLGVGEVSVTGNFFELGGHSLLATRLMLRVREAFGVDIALQSLFESPTVRGLAQAVDQAMSASEGLVAPPLTAVTRNGDLPLSYAQQRLWFLDQLEPDSAFYNCPGAVRLSGELNVSALERTLTEIIRRHEVLRTTFPAVEGKAVQVIAPVVEYKLAVTDLSELEPSEAETEARRLAQVEEQTPFDLANGPLLRAKLVKLSDTEHVALFTMHHIVSDGWSVEILLREVAALYEAFAHGSESTLPELPIQYADYALWQREWLSGAVLDKQLSYWQEQLAGINKVLELPADHVRPAVQSFRGAHHTFLLSEELSVQLQELSRNEAVTLFMTLLAAWQTLLCYYTKQEQVCVGTPIANRNRAETEKLIGFFVNTLVMRGDFSGNPSFREVLRRVREVSLNAYAHQDVPFEKLVEVLQPERSLSNTPLVQVWFAFQNAATTLQLQGLAVNPLRLESSTAKFDLGLDIAQTEQGFVGMLQYKTDLFEASTIRRIARQFETLLHRLVAEPDLRLSSLLETLAATERQRRSKKVKEFRAVDRQTLKNVTRQIITGDDRRREEQI